MAYVPNADDAAAPLDTEHASSGGLEIRTLKAKLNQAFLSSSINTAENAIYSSKGFSVLNTGGVTDEVFSGFRASATRSAGTGSVIGGLFSAVVSDSLTLDSDATAAGIFAEVVSGVTASVCPVFAGATIFAVQRRHSGQASVSGVSVKFQNRLSALDAGAVVGGVGDDKYNIGAAALRIQSQRRSTSTERCGWSSGIKFDAYSLDEDFTQDAAAGHPVAIDFAGIATYDSARRPVPFNFATASLETVATTNGGAVVMPTILNGFLRIEIAGVGGFGIPVCSLAVIP